MKISKLVKNLLTFALAFAIVITVSVPCVWANASDASESTSEAKRAYDFLKAVGAMDTQETEFDTDKMITRAHFVKLALHLSNDAPNVLASGGEVFDDVTPSTDYEAYIETACRIGYISGSTQNLFEPEQTITLAQALKILCGILGYQQLAEINGGFPGGYIVMAQRLGLLSGVDISDNNGLDMANAMILLRNASETKLLQITGINDGLKSETIGDETILSEFHKIKCEEGIITANGYTDLLSRESELDRDRIMINGIVFNSALTDAQDYIGKDVRVYYKTDDNKVVKDVVHVELSEENIIMNFSGEDIKIEKDKVTCFSEDGSASVIRLSGDVTYILNGKMSIMSSADLLGMDKSSIEFISNDGNKTIDVVKIKKYDTILVSGISAYSGIIIANDGSKIEFDPESDKYTFEFTKNDKSADFGSLVQGDVLLISEGAGPGLCHIEVMASDKTVTGSFDEIGDGYVVIGKKQYDLDTALTDKIELGKSYTVHFDAFGSIAHVSANRSLVYGYLYGLAKQGMDKPQCRIFTEYDRWVDLYFAKKVDFNGEAVDAETLFDHLTIDESFRQLIKYKVNDNREIIALATAREYLIGSENENIAIENDIFRISFKGSGQYRSTNRSIDGKVVIDSNARVFIIPSDYDKDEFKIKTVSDFEGDENYTLTAYDADEHLSAKAVVTNDSATKRGISSSDKFMVVKSIGMKLNSEGDTVPSVKGYWNRTEITFPVLVGDGGVSIEELNSLEKGDVVIIKYDDDSNIVRLKKYSLEDEAFASALPSYGAYSGVVACSKVEKIDTLGKKIRIASAVNDSSEHRSISYTSSTTCAIWDGESETYITTGADEILPGDIIFVNMRYFQCTDILIVRNK